MWYEQFKMCSFVTGGNGSSFKPPSADEEIGSSVTTSWVLMVVCIVGFQSDRDICQRM